MGRGFWGVLERGWGGWWVGGKEATYGEIKTPEEVMALIEAVTVEDVQELAAEIIREDRLNLALIGPYADDATFADLLTV